MSYEQTKSFNQSCSCTTINQSKLERIQKEMGNQPNSPVHDFQKFFSSSPTSISKSSLGKIEAFLKSFRNVIENSEIRNVFLQNLNPKFQTLIPKKLTGGLFLGFDFHDTEEGPKLIEINTNAGGLILNSILYEVQNPCCRLLYCHKEMSDFSKWKEQIFQYFMDEWNLYFPDQEFRSIAIMDETPEEQFLYPEFKMIQNLFLEKGKKAVICAPNELHLKEDGIYYLEERIDFIYNRHTDFLLKEQALQNVAAAWEARQVCLSPNPIDYLSFANKTNLELLSNEDFLNGHGIEKSDREVLLSVIPKTYCIKEVDKELHWGNRKKIFFKPQNSFGSKGVYAGRKITKSKFDEILKLNYIAQEEIPPSTRKIHSFEYKIDYRAYVYNFNILMLASRLYQGQTTNFRTEGGGFSPVMEIG